MTEPHRLVAELEARLQPLEVAGLGPAEIATRENALATPGACSSSRSARRVLVMTNFEREPYADPDTDLDARWWDLVEHYQLLARPPGRRAPDWAAKIHVAVAPVFYQTAHLAAQLA